MAEGKVRALVVDDEPLARRRLCRLLRAAPAVELVGECGDGAAAVEAVERLAPDLLLLDVQMPGVDGFGVLDAIPDERRPVVVFVTAYDEYAVRAFEVHALDYLLKPFDRERFDACWQRAKAQILHDRNQNNVDRRILALLEDLKTGQPYLERLVIKAGGRIYFLRTDEIDWIEAEGNYVSVHSGKKSHLLRETISSLDSRLDPKQFVRI